MNKQNLNPWLGTKQEQNFGYWLGTQVRRLKQRPFWVKALYAFIGLAVAALLASFAVVVLAPIAFLCLILWLLCSPTYDQIQRDKIIQELKEIKQLQKRTETYDDNLIGSGNGTGNGINLSMYNSDSK